ncbi:hypothetical protein V8F06_008797 [Rhypophila decipiens]
MSLCPPSHHQINMDCQEMSCPRLQCAKERSVTASLRHSLLTASHLRVVSEAEEDCRFCCTYMGFQDGDISPRWGSGGSIVGSKTFVFTLDSRPASFMTPLCKNWPAGQPLGVFSRYRDLQTLPCWANSRKGNGRTAMVGQDVHNSWCFSCPVSNTTMTYDEHFSLDNLPYGIASTLTDPHQRAVATRLGNHVFLIADLTKWSPPILEALAQVWNMTRDPLDGSLVERR